MEFCSKLFLSSKLFILLSYFVFHLLDLLIQVFSLLEDVIDLKSQTHAKKYSKTQQSKNGLILALGALHSSKNPISYSTTMVIVILSLFQLLLAHLSILGSNT